MNATKQRIKHCVYDECLLIFDTHANTYNTCICIYQINEWINKTHNVLNSKLRAKSTHTNTHNNKP